MIYLGIFNKKRKEVNPEFATIPSHIAIIMDGNGRWAKKRGLPRTLGHKAGVEAIRGIVKECSKIGIKYLTLYAFSTENWKRPQDEVNGLMKLLVQYLKGEFEELNKNNVVINYIGNITEFPKICQEELIKAKNLTKNNTGLTLNLALNYGGRDEVLFSFKNILKDYEKGKFTLEELNEDMISNNLYTKGIPDPELMIRTSGEERLSNFLIWQLAFSEFYFTDVLWPDFNKDDLYLALKTFEGRDRRFGGVK
ncbi:isoprenyl transferase [Oceanirhabdus seepicola]|uniref:Isoprenyl transferase n=1 Tax=Oceanirhabdus seepicola TaxID=2828781 RepID=A0A9J6P2V8_9CLOT|nr:isoprenyl transferase [Oceanirhabdus seepicola]